MRVYLPSTIPALADALAKGEISEPPLRAFAVTPALREAYASGDDEELEYVAMLAAARQSLWLLAADPDAPRRRVVLAADVADKEVSWQAHDDEPAAVAVMTWPPGTSTRPARPAMWAPPRTPSAPPARGTRTPRSRWTPRKVTSWPGTPRRSLRTSRTDAADSPGGYPARAAEVTSKAWMP